MFMFKRRLNFIYFLNKKINGPQMKAGDGVQYF